MASNKTIRKTAASLQNNALHSSDRPRKRRYAFKSEETRQRCLANLKFIQPGEVRNPGGRPRTKPFHAAARALAEINYRDLNIDSNDTVAVAIMKSLALRALNPVNQQGVAAAKELADRAEGAPVQVHEHTSDSEFASKGVEGILVRFGIELAAFQRTDT